MRSLLAFACVLLLPASVAAQTGPILTFGSPATGIIWQRPVSFGTPTEIQVEVRNCVEAANTPIICTALPRQTVVPTCTISGATVNCRVSIAAVTPALTGLHEVSICETYTAIEGTKAFCKELGDPVTDAPRRLRAVIGLEPKVVTLSAK